MLKTDNYDAGEQSSVDRKKRKYQLAREQAVEELRDILSTPAGLYFAWRMLEKAHLFSSVSHPEPQTMAILSGRRDVGLEILEELFEADSNVLNKMRLEAERRESDD